MVAAPAAIVGNGCSSGGSGAAAPMVFHVVMAMATGLVIVLGAKVSDCWEGNVLHNSQEPSAE